VEENQKSKKLTFPLDSSDARIKLKEYLLPCEVDELKDVDNVYYLNLFE